MYLSALKILISKVIFSVILLISSSFVFFATIGLFIEIFTMDEGNSYLGLGVAIGMLVFFIPISIFAIRSILKTGLAKKFNAVFENYSDGEVPVDILTRIFNMPTDKVIKQFNMLLKNGYLVKCTLDYKGEMKIILNNGARTIQERFSIVQCPVCGASNNVKVGFVQACKYCGSEIKNETSQENI